MTRFLRRTFLHACRFAAVAAFFSIPEGVAAQGASQNGSRSTIQGVYGREQWMRGRDVFAMLCSNCHSTTKHTGAHFSKFWAGKRLSDLFGFLRERMPANEPGSLSAQEYVDVVAYLLQMNGMPAGNGELPADSVALTRIRIDSSRVVAPGSR